MKQFFARKSSKLTFLGMIALMSAISVLVVNCKNKDDIAVKDSPVKDPVAKDVPKIEEPEVPSDKRVIYLTFDDGPNKGTENLLKILHKRDAKATSFVVGKHVTGSQSQSKIMKLMEEDSLLEIANHSYTHAGNQYSKFYNDSNAVVADFNTAKDSLKLKSFIARTPGRNIWRLNNINVTDIKSSTNAANELSKNGYKLVGWDLEWKPTKEMKLKGTHEAMLKKVDSIFFNDLEKTPRHLVFLTHDQYLQDEKSMAELDLFIGKLQSSNRFVFKKISDYPKINDVMN